VALHSGETWLGRRREISQDADETLTVGQAASRLGVSPDAIRKRLRRGTLRAWKRDGSWVIPAVNVLETGRESVAEIVPAAAPDTARDMALAYLERERERLAQDLDDSRRENARLVGIIEELTRRLPELPPPPLAGKGASPAPIPQGVGEGSDETPTMPVEAPESGEKPPAPRRWWQKWFGG
jgi:excisionase family DNA binding protein